MFIKINDTLKSIILKGSIEYCFMLGTGDAFIVRLVQH